MLSIDFIYAHDPVSSTSSKLKEAQLTLIKGRMLILGPAKSPLQTP